MVDIVLELVQIDAVGRDAEDAKSIQAYHDIMTIGDSGELERGHTVFEKPATGLSHDGRELLALAQAENL